MSLLTRNSVITDYGGHPEKKDFGGIGSINHLTDVNAEQLTALAEDLAALASCCQLAVLELEADLDGSMFVYNVNWCLTAWGPKTLAPYAGASPPPGLPSAINQASGSYEPGPLRLTFPESWANVFGVSRQITTTGVVPSRYANYVGGSKVGNRFDLAMSASVASGTIFNVVLF